MSDAAAPRGGGRGFLIFAAVGIALLVGLGTWQVYRLHWKEGLIADRKAAFARPPLRLTGNPDEAGTAAWRRVTVTGTFLQDKETLVGPRSRRGVPGWRVVTPLRLANGKIVVIDRGWVPDDLKSPARRAAGRPTGSVTVVGVIRHPAAPGWFIPENDPAKGQWLRIDPAELAASWRLADVAPWWVEALAGPRSHGYPVATAGLTLPDNNHLQYSITWYALAVALAVIAVIRRRAAR